MENKNGQINNGNSWVKNIILFLSSQAVSLFGSSIVQYAIIWYITLNTQSGVMMTIATVAGFLPQVVISVFSGVWADRYSKKKLIMIADSGIAFATLVVAIFMLFGYDNISLLFIVLGIRSLGSGIQGPAITSLLPTIVPTDKLMKINGINTMMQSVILILSPIVSAALLGLLPLSKILFVDIITAIIGVGILSKIKIFEVKKKLTKIDYLGDIRDGIIYVKSHKLIKYMFILFFIYSILFGPASFLTPLMITRAFGDNVWNLTMSEIVFFIGTMLGGGIIATWKGFKNKIITISLGSLLFGLFSVGLGLSSQLYVYLIFFGLIGIIMNFIQTPIVVLLQENVDSDFQGRVFSLLQMVGTGIMPLGMVLYGPLADIVRVELLLVVTGILFIFLSIIIFKYRKLNSNV